VSIIVLIDDCSDSLSQFNFELNIPHSLLSLLFWRKKSLGQLLHLIPPAKINLCEPRFKSYDPMGHGKLHILICNQEYYRLEFFFETFKILVVLTIFFFFRNRRDRPRFFDQVGHQTINASIGIKHFFTK
jgi:hypothetical protein